ncbi:hypothetical protein [Pararhodospirillum oryzae]|uniref:Uncharacterized protein n=1 Tax=Pararhodospirillum oryzae TaxID=478448 RepID=A0A512HB24_9PROT|nr:hypothetical protein [Pararhodospirillum oryzae]GEO82656.1 hypothetical protein ROR02_27870 [Pararhodospirillum oryzae]
MLTPEEIRILQGAPFPGLRPGDNLWPEIEIVDVRSGELVGDGAVADLLIRRRFLEGERMWAPKPDRHPEGFRIEYPFLYRLTEAGREALAAAQAELSSTG